MTVYGFSEESDARVAKQLVKRRRSNPILTSGHGFLEGDLPATQMFCIEPIADIPAAVELTLGGLRIPGSGLCRIIQLNKTTGEEEYAKDAQGNTLTKTVYNRCLFILKKRTPTLYTPHDPIHAISDAITGELYVVESCCCSAAISLSSSSLSSASSSLSSSSFSSTSVSSSSVSSSSTSPTSASSSSNNSDSEPSLSSGAGVCDCSHVVVSISGFTDENCTSCNSFNGSHVLLRQASSCSYKKQLGELCQAGEQAEITFEIAGGGTGDWVVTITTSAGNVIAYSLAAASAPNHCTGTATIPLDFDGSIDCNGPANVSVNP